MLLTAFGFLLSHNLVTPPKALLCLLSSRGHNRISRYLNSCCKQVRKRTFVSYTGIAADFHLMSNARTCLISFLVILFKGVLLLALSLVSVYFTSTLQDQDVRDLLVKIFSGITFGLVVVMFVSDSLQKPYFLGIFRNHLFPHFTGDVKKYKVQRKKLSYASVPQRIILPYGNHKICTTSLPRFYYPPPPLPPHSCSCSSDDAGIDRIRPEHCS